MTVIFFQCLCIFWKTLKSLKGAYLDVCVCVYLSDPELVRRTSGGREMTYP